VKERGPDKFRRRDRAEWAHLKDGPATLIPEEIERGPDAVHAAGVREIRKIGSDPNQDKIGSDPDFSAAFAAG